MSSIKSAALLSFIDHLDQIRKAVTLVYGASAVKQHVAKTTDWKTQDKHALDEVQRFLKSRSFPEQLYVNSLYLSSVAAFEEFLRQVVASAICMYTERANNFDDLSESLQKKHMVATGRLLNLRHNPPQHLRVDFFEVCRRIGTCLPRSSEFELNIEALSMMSDITELDSFFKLLQEFDPDVNWDKLGSQKSLQKCLGTKKPRDTKKELKGYLEEMVRRRNRIAHTGSSSDITRPVLDDHLSLLRATAEAITGLIR